MVFVLLLISIPFVVFEAQKQQEIRQRASTGEVCQVPLKIPVLALEYLPRDLVNTQLLSAPETGFGLDATVNGRDISYWEQKTDESINAIIPYLNDATRFHGYKDTNSPQFLNFYVLDKKKFYDAIPRGYQLGSNPRGGINYRPNYGQILRDINICDYVDGKGVKEVWMYGYHNDSQEFLPSDKSRIVPDESRMSSKYGDISNSLPKESTIPEQYRMPVCNNSYTLYNFIIGAGSQNLGTEVHNRLHQIENMIPFAESKWPPVREDRPSSNIKGSIFWGNFSEYVQDYTKRSSYRSSCGNAHYTPNWGSLGNDYNYGITDKREFNCETWNPDPSKTTYISAGCERWGCNELGFYKWFMQNMPGYNNGIVYNGQQMRNWWEAVYDFNAFIDKGKTLYGESNYPACLNSNLAINLASSPTPVSISVPTSTPTPTAVQLALVITPTPSIAIEPTLTLVPTITPTTVAPTIEPTVATTTPTPTTVQLVMASTPTPTPISAPAATPTPTSISAPLSSNFASSSTSEPAAVQPNQNTQAATTTSNTATTTPNTQVTNFAAGQIIKSKNPVFQGKASPGTKIVITVSSRIVTGTVYADVNGNWTWAVPEELDNGTHKATITATDNQGRSTTTSFEFTVSVQEILVVGNMRTTIFILAIGIFAIILGFLLLKVSFS